MKLKKIPLIFVLFSIFNSPVFPDKYSDGTDSLIEHIKSAYGNIIPPLLDTQIIHYQSMKVRVKSDKIDYNDICDGLYQSAVDDAKKRHPNSNYLNDSIFNKIIINEFSDKNSNRFFSGGYLSLLKEYHANISPVLFGRVIKPAKLKNHVWKNCKQPNLETFVFNCRAFGPPDSMPDTLPYNTNLYRAIAGDTAAQQTIYDSISKLKDPKELYNAMTILGYIGSKNAMQKILEYFPDTTYISEKVYAGKYNPIIIQKTSLRMAIIEALAYNNPDTVPQSFFQNYIGSDNWYQSVTDTTGAEYKKRLKLICWLVCNHHCFKDGPYYPTRLIDDLKKVADWASKRYECKVKMPTSDYKVIPIICIGGALR